LPWRDLALEWWLKGTERLVAQLLADPSFTTQEA
jgi:hypothetical protein